MKSVTFTHHVWQNDDLIPVTVEAKIEDYATAYGVEREMRHRFAGRMEVTLVSVTTDEGREIPLDDLQENCREKLELIAPNYR